MTKPATASKIDLHLVQVLLTLLTTRSVSRTAVHLGMHQPGVSAVLKRLRVLTGDSLLVRSGTGMVPTPTALDMIEPLEAMLTQADKVFQPARERKFDPATYDGVWRIAASDYLDPLFLPSVIARLKQQAPLAQVQVSGLGAGFDYPSALAQGVVDLVIGNWLEPPADLHMARLFSDEIVCMVAANHPVLRRGLSLEKYLAAEHIAPASLRLGALGVIDQLLLARKLQRNITVTSPTFSQIPQIVERSLLVLTTGRLFCSRFEGPLAVRVLPCPVPFPALRYYQLWHDRVHRAPASRWLRDVVKDVAAGLRPN
jgi:DNA-binding transcriptional LysR family regulator